MNNECLRPSVPGALTGYCDLRRVRVNHHLRAQAIDTQWNHTTDAGPSATDLQDNGLRGPDPLSREVIGG